MLETTSFPMTLVSSSHEREAAHEHEREAAHEHEPAHEPELVHNHEQELAHEREAAHQHGAAHEREPALPLPVREGPLSVEDEHRLSHSWRTLEDEAALARMVQAHLGLVIRIAMEFRHSGPSMEDLIQEGNLGLTIAARRFDPSRETRLATYATYWIRACMLEHVVRSHGPVRIGTTRSQRKIFFGLGRARRKLEREGEHADAETLAEALGALIAEDAPNPEDMVAGHEEDDSRKMRLFEGLKVLDPRERAIIKARHMRQRPATLASLGKKFGISRERVRQLELRAKSKLRSFCGVRGGEPAALETYL